MPCLLYFFSHHNPSLPQHLAAVLALRIPPDTHRPGPWMWVACSVFMALYEGGMPGGKTLGDVLKVRRTEGVREGGREGRIEVGHTLTTLTLTGNGPWALRRVSGSSCPALAASRRREGRRTGLVTHTHFHSTLPFPHKHTQATGLVHLEEFLAHLGLLSQRLEGLSDETRGLAGTLRYVSK